ncbi:MAG: beta-lactamase family protein [Alphaproteobacteria bacterium]|nr:beta-lactamase family protein [Alphaproteobacteria bacterium]
MSIAERLDGVIGRAIAEKRVVGCLVIAIRDGREIYNRAAGFADREAGVPVRQDTIFRLASVTKPIVAATVLALVDRGALALDAPVTDYLPWFAPKTENGATPVITVRQLLSHSAGLAYGGQAFERAGITTGIEHSRLTLEDNIRRVATAPLLYPPGTGWAYSIAIDVLGAVIAEIEGTTLGAAVARYVTGPLGMADTAFIAVDPERLATAYGNAPGGAERMRVVHTMPNPWGTETTFLPGRILDPTAFHSGGGGMAGTAPDFAKLLLAFLDGGAPILSPEMARTAFVDQIPGIVRPDAPGSGFSTIGAILRDPVVAGIPGSVGTVQWGGIYGNHWFVDPRAKFALVAFTNTAFEGSDGPFRFEIRDAAYPIG